MARSRNTNKTHEEAIAENISRDQEEAITENASRDKSKLTRIIVIIAAVFAAVTAFVFFVPVQYKLIFIIAALVLALVFFASKKERRVSNVMILGILAVIAFIFFPTLSLWASQGYSYASDVYSGIKSGGMGEGFTCAFNPDKCFGEQAWESQGTQQIGGTTIKVDWTGVTRTSTYATVPIQVTTQEPINIEFACFNAGGDILAQPQSILFEKSTTKSLICSSQNDIGNKLGVRMKSSYNQTLSFEIWAGQGDSKGKLDFINSDGPYTVEISSIDEQPFNTRIPLSIKLKKLSSSIFELTSIETFDVSSGGENLNIACNKMTGSKDELKSNFADNTYSFICYTEILKMPPAPVKAVASVNLKYNLEGNDSTTLKT